MHRKNSNRCVESGRLAAAPQNASFLQTITMVRFHPRSISSMANHHHNKSSSPLWFPCMEDGMDESSSSSSEQHNLSSTSFLPLLSSSSSTVVDEKRQEDDEEDQVLPAPKPPLHPQRSLSNSNESSPVSHKKRRPALDGHSHSRRRSKALSAQEFDHLLTGVFASASPAVAR